MCTRHLCPGLPTWLDGYLPCARAAGGGLCAAAEMALAQLVAALAFRPTASPARRTNINMMEHDASTLELKAQILQVAALTDRGQRLNTLSEWHASNARPTH